VSRISAALHSCVSARRKDQGLTQQQLARMVGTSRQTVVEMEGGNYNPSTALALRLAVVLYVRVEDLFRLPETEAAALLTKRAQQGTDAER
jgi:putative transcriptional regulator